MAIVNAAASFSAGARLGASGAFIQKAAAHLSASPSLLVSGTGTALAAAPRLTATGRVVKTAQASLSASPVLTASGSVPTLSAQPVLTATARVTELPSAHLSAAATLTAFFSSASAALHAAPVLLVPGRAGAVVLSAGTQLTASASTFKAGAASLAASPALHATALVTERAQAPLAAPGTLSATPLVTGRASAHLAAPGTLHAAFSSSAAALAASPALQALAQAIRAAQGHFTATGHLMAGASVTERATASLAAPAALHASAFRVQHFQAALAAQPRLTANAHHTVGGAGAMTASPVLHAIASRRAVALTHLAATPSLSAAGAATRGVRLSASPVLTVAGHPARPASARLAAAATLTATAHGTVRPAGALRAAPALRAVPLGVIISRAALAATASLAATAKALFRPPLPLPPPRAQPTWQRDIQHWAITQERMRHAQALWQYGELVMFCLLWRPADIAAGLARRCTRCFSPSSVIPLNPPDPSYGAAAEAQISAAYGQGNQYRCTLCYGTQVIAARPAEVPGVRALLVRPAILTDTDQNQQRTAKGVVNPGSVDVQATPDFRAHTLDYCFRSDGRRYQLAVPGRVALRTGFASPWQQAAGIAYNLMRATLEDTKASVAYVIPPPARELAAALGTYTRIPASYSWIEQANGPLIPGEVPPPAASGRYQTPVTLGQEPPPPPSQPPVFGAVFDEGGAPFEDEAGNFIFDESGS